MELFNLINKDEDIEILSFTLRGCVAITSPTFCLIFFFIPNLLDKYKFDTIFTLSCTINIILICTLLSFLSDKLKVARNIINIKKYNEEYSVRFIEEKKKFINLICRNILNRIFNYMIFFTMVTIIFGIFSKNILSENLYICYFALFITIIGQVFYICIYKFKVMKYTKDMKSQIEKMNDIKLRE